MQNIQWSNLPYPDYVSKFVQKEEDFLRSEAFGIYNLLFPRKILFYIQQYLNRKMKEHFGCDDEKAIKKKLYKIDHIQEYFGVKVLMSYLRMPTYNDYFDTEAPFQAKFKEGISQGRCRIIEFQTGFMKDKELLKPSTKSFINDTYRICKKINKIQQRYFRGQKLLLMINPQFTWCKCYILIDIRSGGVVSVGFQQNPDEEILMAMLQRFLNLEHIVYFLDKLLTFEQCMQLREQNLYTVGYIKSEVEESMYNEKVSLLLTPTGILLTTCYTQYSIKYGICESQAKSQIHVLNELHEVCIWNAHLVHKSLGFLQFKLTLIKQLLESSISRALTKYPDTPLNRKKIASIGCNTEITGQFGNTDHQAVAHSTFHVPTPIVIPKFFNGTLLCLVCKRVTAQLIQCKACSDISSKMVVLCACECFYRFHGSTHDFISYGEDFIREEHVKRPQKKSFKSGLYYGELSQNKRDGFGLMSYENRYYIGQWVNDRKHGKGKEQLANGDTYEGAFQNGRPNGEGILITSNGIYQGHWEQGIREGFGRWRGSGGEQYTGEWKQNKANGHGRFEWADGSWYEGEFRNFLKNGKGREKFPNGDSYDGEYINDKPDGFGFYQWKDGGSYRGQFCSGMRHGKGYWKGASLDTYEGEYINDLKCGFGIYRWHNGNVYEGDFFNDYRHGSGEMRWVDGSYYKGGFNNGVQSGQGELKRPNHRVISGVFEESRVHEESKYNFQPKIKRQSETESRKESLKILSVPPSRIRMISLQSANKDLSDDMKTNSSQNTRRVVIESTRFNRGRNSYRSHTLNQSTQLTSLSAVKHYQF